MATNLGRRRTDQAPAGAALWLRILMMLGVLAAAALMAWQVSGAVDSNHAAAVKALRVGEQRNAQLAARADAAAAQAVHAQQLVAAIQLSRKRDCLAQNYRHNATVKTFERLLRQAARHSTPAERHRAQANRHATLQLLNAIVPSRDCSVSNP